MFFIQVSTELVHSVRWLIRDYEDMTITEGDAVTFAWDGFHSLHQVCKIKKFLSKEPECY